MNIPIGDTTSQWIGYLTEEFIPSTRPPDGSGYVPSDLRFERAEAALEPAGFDVNKDAACRTYAQYKLQIHDEVMVPIVLRHVQVFRNRAENTICAVCYRPSILAQARVISTLHT